MVAGPVLSAAGNVARREPTVLQDLDLVGSVDRLAGVQRGRLGTVARDRASTSC